MGAEEIRQLTKLPPSHAWIGGLLGIAAFICAQKSQVSGSLALQVTAFVSFLIFASATVKASEFYGRVLNRGGYLHEALSQMTGPLVREAVKLQVITHRGRHIMLLASVTALVSSWFLADKAVAYTIVGLLTWRGARDLMLVPGLRRDALRKEQNIQPNP